MTQESVADTSSQPRMNILSQYVQEVSFANHAARNNASPKGKPTISIQAEVDKVELGSERWRVLLTMKIDAKSQEDQVFAINLVYAGVFRLANVDEKSIAPILEVEAPRLLFPFARRIIAELSRDGGYPPLMLDPIDFALLYRRRLSRAAEKVAEDASCCGSEKTATKAEPTPAK